MFRHSLPVLAFSFFLTAAAGSAAAQDAPAAPAPPVAEEIEAPTPTFEHDLGIGTYGSGWAGAYLGVGGGGRLRWEPLDWLGIEIFGETYFVDTPNGTRHDHPIGFNTFFPIGLGEHFRFRPLFGMCVVFSMIEPEMQDAPRADDVLFGIHAGAGVEWSPFRTISFFLDLKAIAYLGHDRTAEGWTGSVDEEYTTFGIGQVNLGAAYHFSL